MRGFRLSFNGDQKKGQKNFFEEVMKHKTASLRSGFVSAPLLFFE